MPTVEQVMNKPLSGQEVREIVIAKFREKLSGDTRLADYVAVPAFEFRIDFTMLLDGAVHNEIRDKIEHRRGTVDEHSDNLTAITAHIQQSQMPPNQARVDAGLEVPVLSHDEKGRPVEKGVKYAKEKLQKSERGG